MIAEGVSFGTGVLVLMVVFGAGVLIMQWATMDWREEDDRDHH